MPYPNSFDVFDGMPTAFQHYNNLRGDALRFGQTEANAANVGAMMGGYATGIQLEIIEPKRIRLAASAAAPAAIMIGGYPLLVTANVDLAAGLAPVGVAADYYIFAVRADGQTGFSLDVNTTPTETATRRIIGQFYYDGTRIIKETIRSIWQAGLYGGGVASQEAGGRLTLISGNGLIDAGGSTTVYYTPYSSGRIALYVVGFGWRVYGFTEASLALAGLTTGNYDIFGYNLSGEEAGLVLEAVKWTTDIARATAVVKQDGVWVKNGEPERRYLGTIRLYGVGMTIDSLEQRYVWNVDNRMPRMLFKRADAANWVYAGLGVWRMANANSINRVQVVVGLPDAWLDVQVTCGVQITSNGDVLMGLSLDDVANAPSSNANARAIMGHFNNAAATVVRVQLFGKTWGQMAIGYHFLQWMEMTNTASATFYGQTATGAHGITGYVEG